MEYVHQQSCSTMEYVHQQSGYTMEYVHQQSGSTMEYVHQQSGCSCSTCCGTRRSRPREKGNHHKWLALSSCRGGPSLMSDSEGARWGTASPSSDSASKKSASAFVETCPAARRIRFVVLSSGPAGLGATDSRSRTERGKSGCLGSRGRQPPPARQDGLWRGRVERAGHRASQRWGPQPAAEAVQP